MDEEEIRELEEGDDFDHQQDTHLQYAEGGEDYGDVGGEEEQQQHMQEEELHPEEEEQLVEEEEAQAEDEEENIDSSYISANQNIHGEDHEVRMLEKCLLFIVCVSSH